MAPRKTAATAATTLYRLTGLTGLRGAIRAKYLDSAGFEFRECAIGDRQSAVVLGHIETEQAKWANTVNALIEDSVDAHNVTAAAVLLVPGDDGVTWALSYGMGFLLLEQSHVDPGFGQRLAVRVADADHLNSLTRKTMDDRAKVDRSSIPAGDHLRGFGIGGFGELVTRLVATAKLPGLSVEKSFKLRGADGLNIPLGRTPTTLLSDLDVIAKALQQPVVKDLEVLEQLVALKKGSKTANQLDAALVKSLKREGDETVGAAWPHESVNENGTPAAFGVKGRGKHAIRSGVPTVDDIYDVLDPANVLASLDQVRIQLYSDPDGDNAISPDIALRKWIAFETNLAGHRYFLHDGAWYLMDNAYAAQLRSRVQSIFDRQCDLTLPPWPTTNDGKLIPEKDYNALAAKACSGVLLDRKLIYTTQNPRGFETCDILTPDGTLVHVKNIDASAPASHLFAQGANSAHTLSFDDEARAEFRQRVQRVGGDPELVKHQPSAVVFAIARNSAKPFTAETLYSFSQVTLARTCIDLEARRIPVYVIPIDRAA
jgi:uncharacterized protein (TIGR04141 family)